MSELIHTEKLAITTNADGHKKIEKLIAQYHETCAKLRQTHKELSILREENKVWKVEEKLPDSGIAVLALGDLDGWTVAAIDDDEGGEWVEQSTGDRITVLKWMHLPAEEDESGHV